MPSPQIKKNEDPDSPFIYPDVCPFTGDSETMFVLVAFWLYLSPIIIMHINSRESAFFTRPYQEPPILSLISLLYNIHTWLVHV